MKKFSVPTNFNNGQKVNIDVYIGKPGKEIHPLFFQSNWLDEERGGTIPKKVMDGFKDLLDISAKSETTFEDLCMYAIEKAEMTDNEEKGNKIDKLEVVEFFNKIEELASAEQLKHCFDDNFNLLLLQFKKNKDKICHVILLTREETVAELKVLVDQKKITMDIIYQFGIVEYISDIKPSSDVYNKLQKKYHA